jgi:hypothetical protein
MANVTGSGSISLNDTFTYSTGFNTGQSVAQTRTINSNQLSNGTAADQINLVGAVRLTFTASTPQTIDLTTALLDPSGSAVAFSKIKRLLIKFVSPTTDGATVTIKHGTSNGWTNFIDAGAAGVGLTLQAPTANNDAGSAFVAPNTTGWVVTSTNKTLTITPNAYHVVLDIIADGV